MPEGVATHDFAPLRPVPSGYGIAEFGAPWSEASGVLVMMHGRDRDAQDLPIAAIGLERVRRRRILAPFAQARTWYPGRYDAPYGVNRDGLRTAIDLIVQAFALAGAHGHGAGTIVLAGFSQGGCVVADYLASGRALPAAAAIFTGALPDLANRAPVAGLEGLALAISGGTADPWLPVADLRATAAFFERAGATVQMEDFGDADHVVRPLEIARLDALLEPIAG